MSVTVEPMENAVRGVTNDEIATYQRDGWVELSQFVRPDVVDELLRRLRNRMGFDAQAEVSGGFGTKVPRPPQSKALFNAYEYPSRDDEYVRDFALSRDLGQALSSCAGGPVRSWGDNCFVKMPIAKGGGRTPWHQDWPYYPFDRVGSLTIWIALVDVPPARGPMQFVNGSHMWGAQGRVIHRTDGKDTLDILPALYRDRIEISPERHMRAGDATIHNDLTIHSAPANQTDDPRWVFQMTAFPADTLYTGSPQRRTDDLGLAINEPLNHPNFPVL